MRERREIRVGRDREIEKLTDRETMKQKKSLAEIHNKILTSTTVPITPTSTSSSSSPSSSLINNININNNNESTKNNNTILILRKEEAEAGRVEKLTKRESWRQRSIVT